MKSYYTPSENKLEQLDYVCGIIKSKSNIDNLEVAIDKGSIVVNCNKEDLLSIVKFLKENIRCLFKQLTDITAVDYPEREERFEVIYLLLSLDHNIRLILKTKVNELEMLDSVSYYYANADWLEREVWDMFGIYFNEHPDLRRILTDYGFDGHPLRKDFPLTGFMEVIYDDEQKKVVYKPVELAQEYRDFSKTDVWSDSISSVPLNIKKE